MLCTLAKPDLIKCICSHIRVKILDDIREAKSYSILCEEVADISNKEQVSVVMFVENTCSIREEFVDFISVEKITGEVLAHEIKSTINKYGLNFEECRGQGYDGASNMSCANGVQGHLRADNPKVTYVHCNSHVLTLCSVEACSLLCIRNMNSTITETVNLKKKVLRGNSFLKNFLTREAQLLR